MLRSRLRYGRFRETDSEREQITARRCQAQASSTEHDVRNTETSHDSYMLAVGLFKGQRHTVQLSGLRKGDLGSDADCLAQGALLFSTGRADNLFNWPQGLAITTGGVADTTQYTQLCNPGVPRTRQRNLH
jgi:hypothetical protein